MAARKTAPQTDSAPAPVGDDRIAIWNQLTVTDSKFTKKFDRAGFKGDAINPTWIMRRLTEMFGPAGIGWHLVLDDEKFVTGHTLRNGDKAIVHVVRGRLAYRPTPTAEWVTTGPQFGQTTMVGENKHGSFTDEEAPKKSITDCLGKCAVQLGLGADIHLGLWDASKYVNDPADNPPPRPPAPAPAPAAAPVAAPAPVVPGPPGVDMAGVERSIRSATTVAALIATFNDLCRFPALYGDGNAWSLVCAWVVETFKTIGDVTSPDATNIVALLNNERARLDGLGLAA